MEHVEGNFLGSAQYSLYYQAWLPEGSAEAVLVIVHGIVEHSGRYKALAEFLSASSIAVYAFDLRHHGRSPGRKGYIDNYDVTLKDIEAFIAFVKTRQPAKKVFLFGHSMGAALALRSAQTNPGCVDGLLLSGTPLRIQPHIPLPIIALLLPLTVLTPALGLYKLDSSTLSHDRQVVKDYDKDPLVYRGKLTCRLIISFLWMLHKIEAGLTALNLPVLIMHGSADKLCAPQGARVTFSKISSQDKTLRIFAGFFHEILNEPEKQTVQREILEWLKRHLP
jgi:alpha-beta hydrolase superfamily lysophospholipase